jgi:transposase-like protein
MPRSGPRQVYQYTKAFKLAAVLLSPTPEMQVQAVATIVHPLILSKWRKDIRDDLGWLRTPRQPPFI